jgi:hypothetical protein
MKQRSCGHSHGQLLRDLVDLHLKGFVYTLTSDLLIQPIKYNVELKIQPRNL